MFLSHKRAEAAYPRENFLLAFIRAIGFFLFYYTVRTVISNAAYVLFVIKYKNPDDAYGAYLKSANMLSFISGIVIIFFLVIFFASQKKRIAKALYLGRPSVFTVLLCFFIGFILNFATTYIMSFLPEKLLDSYGEAASNLTNGSTLWYILAAVIMAPILEELIFRAMMVSRFSTATGNTLAVVLASAVFGAVHGHIVWSSYAFIIGLLLGLIFVRSRSVAVSIAAHLGFNLVSLLPDTDGLSEKAAQIYNNSISACYLISVPLSVVLIIFFIRKTKDSASNIPIGIEEF